MNKRQTILERIIELMPEWYPEEKVRYLVEAEKKDVKRLYVLDCKKYFFLFDVKVFLDYFNIIELLDDKKLKRYARKSIESIMLLISYNYDDKTFICTFNRIIDKLSKIKKKLNDIELKKEAEDYYLILYEINRIYRCIHFARSFKKGALI